MDRNGAQLDAKEYLRTVSCSKAIEEFNSTLGAIGKTRGWTLKQIEDCFSNQLWDEIV